MKPLAIVTPWFGKDLKGGAEQQAWQIATRLVERGHVVEVLTTCCRSFFDDWAVNYFQPGFFQEQNFKIRRFSVDQRDRQRFDQLNGLMLSLSPAELKAGVNPVTSEQAHVFSSENINSNELLHYLKINQDKYHAFIFIPYLYGPILNGLPIVASKAFLQPCLHDEVYAYLPQVANIFHLARGLVYNSDGEAKLAEQLYGPGITFRSVVVGEGVEAGQCYDDAISQIGDFSVKAERFILYLGRREALKNVDLLVRAYAAFQHKYPNSRLKLVLAGLGNASFSGSTPGLIDLGFVQESEKEALLANCLALFQPSQKESYSRVMMEAWFYGKPVAVHRDCLATAMAVEQSQGGWLATIEPEWQDLFLKIDSMQEDKLAQYGSNGKKYAEDNATWDKIIKRYEAVLELPTPEAISTGRKVLTQLRSRELKEIHQLLPNLTYGDAISNHALVIRDRLRNCGYNSSIFVKYLDPLVEKEAQVFQPNSINKDAGLLYHHSIGSELTAYAINHPGPKCLIYHNITPAEFYQPYLPEVADILAKGRAELSQLGPHFSVSVGDSAYNAAELAAFGFYDPGVLYIAVDIQKWNIPVDTLLMEQLQDGKSNLLFVGRLAPNKCQAQLVELFSHYLTMDREARLILVGANDIENPYCRHIHDTIQQLDLQEHVIVTGQVNDAQLLAFYRTAHLFLSMSEHEGFCVPIVESMLFDIPVLAYKSTAVPEILREAGILFNSKGDLLQVAALAKLLVKDDSLRAKVINYQRKRKADFAQTVLNKSLSRIILQMQNIDKH